MMGMSSSLPQGPQQEQTLESSDILAKIGAQGPPPSEDFLRSLATQTGDASTYYRPLYTSRPEVDEKPAITIPDKPEDWDSETHVASDQEDLNIIPQSHRGRCKVGQHRWHNVAKLIACANERDYWKLRGWAYPKPSPSLCSTT